MVHCLGTFNVELGLVDVCSILRFVEIRLYLQEIHTKATEV
jgi:hypothetical protein